MQPAKDFDLFLSFVSEDSLIAERLQVALSERGLRVWMGQGRVRPGDQYPDALAQAMAQCKAIALVVTPETLQSDWTGFEYRRALSLADPDVPRIIPLLFRSAQAPGFLADLHCVDFADYDAFERNVDQVIWPGVTSRRVVFVGIHPGRRAPWPRFRRKLDELGVQFVQGENINRARFHIGQIAKAGSHRIVVVLDIFEDWPVYGWPRRNSPEEYADFLFDIRRKTKGTRDEVVILLFNHSEAFDKAEHSLDEHKRQRLSRYCHLHGDLEEDLLESGLRAIWHRLQRELLEAEVEDFPQSAG